MHVTYENLTTCTQQKSEQKKNQQKQNSVGDSASHPKWGVRQWTQVCFPSVLAIMSMSYQTEYNSNF